MSASTEGKRPLFISYRRADNKLLPPPDEKKPGYITHFCKQLEWELSNAGLPAESLWIDRNQLEPADKFTAVIRDQLGQTDIMLAIASNGYASSGWCREEVDYFAKCIAAIPDDERKRRIFRVDKHRVSDGDLPPALRDVQAICLYEEDPDTGIEREFYYRGKLRRKTPYEQAIGTLANAIRKRIKELKLDSRTAGPNWSEEKAETDIPLLPPPKPTNGRTVYVAVPAFELEEQYITLVRELSGRGFRVLPERELPRQGADALRTVRNGVAEAELSIHLLGDKRGFQPEDLSTGIVSLQLAEAAEEAKRKPNFCRLVWAPKIMPDGEESSPARDPLEVLARYDERLATDEVDGDTAARFNDFALQTLRARELKATPNKPAPGKAPTLYLAYTPNDQKLAFEAAKQLKGSGVKPLLLPNDTSFTLASRADHVAVCWGTADDVDVLETLDTLAESEWRRLHPDGKLILLTFDSTSDTQQMALELNSYGAADAVIDGSQPASLASTLFPPP